MLQFLTDLTELKDQHLPMKFLEYLVNEKGSREERYHTQLAREYLHKGVCPTWL